MKKYTNARLVFTRLACVFMAITLAMLLCAACSAAQQYSSQALPDDWPQTISVPGMEKVTGLVQGENNLSYSINIISEDSGKINFQVNAFCVYNPASDYAMLHILNNPLPGVVDQDKKTLQIDFSPLDTGLKSVSIIDKSDVSKVLMQDKNSLVLNTAMAVDSADESQVKFSITDMSLMQPDGVLNEFSLPEAVPAYYSPETDRFSTVAFDEMASVMQQNYVLIQQNTYVNVVNIVNEVNVINVVGFGGYGGWGCGYGGGIPYSGCGYGDYGGYGGCGDYYGGYGGGYAPYCDPLPLVNPGPVPPLGIPHDVPVYRARHSGLDDRMPIAERRDHGGRYSDAGGRYSDGGPGFSEGPGDRMAPYTGQNVVPGNTIAADNPVAPMGQGISTPAFTQSRPDTGVDRTSVRSVGSPARRTSDLSKPVVDSVSNPTTRVTRPATTVTQDRPNPRSASTNLRSANAPAKQTSARSTPALQTTNSRPTTKITAPVASTSLDQTRPNARTAPTSVKSASAPTVTRTNTQPSKQTVTRPVTQSVRSPASSSQKSTSVQHAPEASSPKTTSVQQAPAVTRTSSQPAKQTAARQTPSYKSGSAPQTVKSSASPAHKATSVQRSPAVSAPKTTSVKQAPATTRTSSQPSKQTVTRPATQTVKSPASSQKAASVQRAPQASSPKTTSVRQAQAPARSSKSSAPSAPSHAVSRPSSSGGGRKK
ncbi:hypothetical protein MCP_0583 [Methanocella paludicola SANAE]|uniref:Uncharacterized protein n=1 Tax=Methanocella paludicola (strain DSM 17711 / JCM 13418 / NBRC 101707 / SANAE) TaxID=304371 RepID=D1YW33_METPS|nr:hypothetical protein [Methanocella paludicola]BAI60655.1 hypothetical protein MCP_0583 [Methanocella paludicola SANAE]